MSKRGDGYVYTRPDSRYWRVSFYADGREQREVARDRRTGKKLEATEGNRPEAERYLKFRREKVIASENGGPGFIGVRQDNIRVSCGAADAEREADCACLCCGLEKDFKLRDVASAQTISTLKHVRIDFAHQRATRLTAEAVDAYIEKRIAAGDAPASINRTTQLLKQAFNLAIARKRLSTAPAIRHLSENNARSGFFTEAEFRRLLSHLPTDLRDYVLFAYVTGMRKAEISSLLWADVQADTIVLQGANSKNGEGRSVPLIGELAEVIARRRTARVVKTGDTMMVSDLVFHRGGLPVAEFRKSWATATRRAGCPGRLFHDLRRCAARNLLASGVPQAVAMKITGHRTDSMFRRYAIVTDGQQREALQRAEAYRAAQFATDASTAKVASIN